MLPRGSGLRPKGVAAYSPGQYIWGLREVRNASDIVSNDTMPSVVTRLICYHEHKYINDILYIVYRIII